MAIYLGGAVESRQSKSHIESGFVAASTIVPRVSVTEAERISIKVYIILLLCCVFERWDRRQGSMPQHSRADGTQGHHSQ
jgi:hypothetical protein